jgi:thermitase
MNSHVRLKLNRNIPDSQVPYWQDILTDKTVAVTTIYPDIDGIFSKYKMPVWVTKEYKPASKNWTQTEIASGLNRIYRIILQQDTQIPDRLIQEISLLPIVEEAQIGTIGHADLPSMMPAQMSATTDLRSRNAIYLEQARQFTLGSPSVTVAVPRYRCLPHSPKLLIKLQPALSIR